MNFSAQRFTPVCSVHDLIAESEALSAEFCCWCKASSHTSWHGPADRQTLYVMSLRHCFFLLSCFHSFPKRCSSHSIFITRLPTPGVAFALALLTQQVLGGIVPDMLSLVSAIGKLPPQMGL